MGVVSTSQEYVKTSLVFVRTVLLKSFEKTQHILSNNSPRFLNFSQTNPTRADTKQAGVEVRVVYYRQQVPALITPITKSITPITKSITLELWYLLCLSVNIVRGRITVAT